VKQQLKFSNISNGVIYCCAGSFFGGLLGFVPGYPAIDVKFFARVGNKGLNYPT